jgi:sec-independent protein translocase protein TatB
MFDIGGSEILVIAVVAILVVGPKELPRMLRSFGKTMGQVRRMSNDFKRQFDEALREAERQSGLDETRKDLQNMTRANPLKDAQKDLDSTMRAAGSKTEASPKKAVPSPSPAPESASAKAHEAEPLKTGAAAEQGSDAA